SGFMRPHLLFMLRLLQTRGVETVDILYSEPIRYAQQDETKFTLGSVDDVRQVAGYEGRHQPASSPEKDVLLIGAGYEYDLINYVSSAKNTMRKLQLIGFPSLQADFYQESRLNIHKANEELADAHAGAPIFAPANDPFVT